MNENQYGVLLESILDKVNAIAEGQRNIERNLNNFRDETGQRLDKVENRLDKVETQMDSMKKEIKAVKKYVIGIDDAINQHEKRIQGVEKNAI